MPYAPLNSKCSHLGCQNKKTSRSSFCTEHGGGVTDKGRRNSELYGQAFWRKMRTIQLSRQPLCMSCLARGKVVQAEHVDHVFPHRQDSARFKNNIYQSLCPACHTLKTQMENRGIYQYFSPNGLIEYKETDYQRVINF